MNENVKKQVIQIFEFDITNGKKAIEKFIEDLQKNPEHALSWADHMFTVVPALRFAEYMIDYVKSDEADLDVILSSIEREVIQRASSITNKSTGQCKNMLTEGALESHAKNLEQIKRLVKFSAEQEARKSQEANNPEADQDIEDPQPRSRKKSKP